MWINEIKLLTLNLACTRFLSTKTSWTITNSAVRWMIVFKSGGMVTTVILSSYNFRWNISQISSEESEQSTAPSQRLYKEIHSPSEWQVNSS